VYEGEFRYNAIEGHGKYQWTDGSHYEGEVKASLRDGVGTFIAPNDEAKYTGEWKDGLRHGKGRIEFAGGAVYEGDFFNGYKVRIILYIFFVNTNFLKQLFKL
jgi:hypothetical protein